MSRSRDLYSRVLTWLCDACVTVSCRGFFNFSGFSISFLFFFLGRDYEKRGGEVRVDDRILGILKQVWTRRIFL